MFSDGKRSEAVATLQTNEAYERDHPMYYADILPRPAGEMLGDMLLLLERPQDALAAYKEALALAPKRLNSLVGAAEAAERCGDHDASAHFLQQLKEEGAQLSPRPK